MRAWRTTFAILGLTVLGAPAFGANPGRPGAVNYVEGAAYLDGQPLNNRNVGGLTMNAGEELTTAAGKAEVLLTPGVYLRVDDRSAVKMISPDLALTQVEVDRGRAGVEVDQLFPQNDVQIVDGGVTTQLVKTGYYEFDANHFNGDGPEAMVFKGRAEVEIGDGKYEAVKSHHEVALVQDAHLKTVNFDAHGTGDDLYNWSSLRSQYLAEANNQIAGEYAYGPGFYPGWYWDPYAWDYTFIGANPFFSPFGWGFYPWGGFYGGGFYGRGFYRAGAYRHRFYGGFHGHPGYGFRGGAGSFHGSGGHR